MGINKHEADGLHFLFREICILMGFAQVKTGFEGRTIAERMLHGYFGLVGVPSF